MSVMYIRDGNGSLVPVRTIKGEKGDTGEQGLAGTNGQDGVSPVLSVSKDGKVTTITITDANGTKTATINDGVDGTDGNGEGDGTSGAYSLLGKTPKSLSNGKTVKLSSAQECTYSVLSDTVADFHIESGSPVNATLTTAGNYHQLLAGDVSNWYSSYVDVTADGLIVGENYSFVFDAVGAAWDDAGKYTVGHYILYDEDGNTLATRVPTEGAMMHVHAFTASTKSVRLRWYPAAYNTFTSGESIASVRKIYINRAGTTDHTDVVNLAGTFTGTMFLGGLPGGVSIASEPPCYVYVLGTAESAASRHAGKKCVCFGDSVTGNMNAPYDYPSVLAKETGMEVVNAGFGGTRMSDTHPTECYAAFSMVRLIDAVTSSDWTQQDALVDQMSKSTNAVEHLATLKAVSWGEVDFVTIAYGTNDIYGSVAIDNANDIQDTTTYLGALRYSLGKLLTAYPHLRVLLLTPIYRYWLDENVDSDEKLFNGHRFTEWGNGLMVVGQEYKMPVLDLYHTLGFNKLTRKYFFPATDGTHPNAMGQRRIGEKVASKLLSEY